MVSTGQLQRRPLRVAVVHAPVVQTVGGCAFPLADSERMRRQRQETCVMKRGHVRGCSKSCFSKGQ